MLQLSSISNQAGRSEDASLRRFRFLHAAGADVEVSVRSPQTEPLRLLLVEQDEAMRNILHTTLSPHYQVEAVANGLDACHAAKSCPPDLVIIDLYLPGTDNLTLIRSLRADPRTTMLPIIMLTASVHRELLLRCLTAGASNFMLKPFQPAELLTCVRLDLELRGPHATGAK